MKRIFNQASEWDYYLSFGFLFGAAVLRSVLLYYRDSAILALGLGLLAVYLALFFTQAVISRRWAGYFLVYLVLQTALVFTLLHFPEPADYFAVLYAILSAQVMRHLPPRWGTACIALFSILTFFPVAGEKGIGGGLALTLIYLAANALLGSYALASRRVRAARAQNQATLQELQETNLQLQAYSKQLEQLTVARERSRLGRELHDSVTQSIFSLTLTAQSALLLLERDPSRVAEQLQRMNELGRGALAEMQTLISTLDPRRLTPGGLEAALRRHIQERLLPEGYSVSLEVEGSRPLAPAEEQGLFRIAQEALNNIVKHAGPCQTTIQVHLAEPCWMEIRDHGLGFNPVTGRRAGGEGLASMGERAAEIGWTLQLSSTPGEGTRVYLEKTAPSSASLEPQPVPERAARREEET